MQGITKRDMEIIIEGYSSIEENEKAMEKVFEELRKNPLITMVTLQEKRSRSYPLHDVAMLREYLNISSQAKLNIERELESCKKKAEIKGALERLYKDPVGAFLSLEKAKKALEGKKECKKLASVLRDALASLSSSQLLSIALRKRAKYKSLGREIYKYAFSPHERSIFSSTLIYPSFPKGGELISEYKLADGSKIRIFNVDGVNYHYHITPSEFLLSEEEERIAEETINEIVEREQFIPPENAREVVREMARALLIKKIRNAKNVPTKSLAKLLEIVVRNTIGYNFIDIILLDDEIEDIYVNKYNRAIYIHHSRYEECSTNIVPSKEDIEKWAIKLKVENNKPLDESHPVLDGNIKNERALVRVSAIHKPLNVQGISIAIRRHREIPITLPLLVKYKSMPSIVAAYLSITSLFGRAMLISGSRGSGKTTLLGALLFELPPKYRVVVIEDTLELPISSLIENNYNVVSMKSKSFLSIAERELEAENALKASLRFGDSCLILGEVRGKEAVALYEAMRVGALANFVGGTLHAESPYGVFDRVVNDLGVKKASFKATDIIVILSQIKTPSAITRRRILTSIVEVKKNWENDPIKEKAFLEIVKYEYGKHKVKLKDSEVIEKIASTLTTGYKKEKLINMIKDKAKAIDYLIELSKRNEKVLSPSFVINANIKFISSLEEKKGLSWWKEEVKAMMKKLR